MADDRKALLAMKPFASSQRTQLLSKKIPPTPEKTLGWPPPNYKSPVVGYAVATLGRFAILQIPRPLNPDPTLVVLPAVWPLS